MGRERPYIKILPALIRQGWRMDLWTRRYFRVLGHEDSRSFWKWFLVACFSSRSEFISTKNKWRAEEESMISGPFVIESKGYLVSRSDITENDFLKIALLRITPRVIWSKWYRAETLTTVYPPEIFLPSNFQAFSGFHRFFPIFFKLSSLGAFCTPSLSRSRSWRLAGLQISPHLLTLCLLSYHSNQGQFIEEISKQFSDHGWLMRSSLVSVMADRWDVPVLPQCVMWQAVSRMEHRDERDFIWWSERLIAYSGALLSPSLRGRMSICRQIARIIRLFPVYNALLWW
jgi:hypothetical protein